MEISHMWNSRKTSVGLAAGIWLLAMAAGMAGLADYSMRAGEETTPPYVAPPAARAASGKYQLLMFAHPRCPCTAASLAELSRVLARCGDRVDAQIWFYRPENESDEWSHTSLWNTAVAIPGVTTLIDVNGDLASQFDARTSGSIALYDAAGTLRYHGGITASRGHEGDNLGKSTLLGEILGTRSHVGSCPVFGCVLRRTDDAAVE
jgi:hypothetical protein